MPDDFRYKEFCLRCETQIEQIDLGDGSFGCPYCKCDDQIHLQPY